jgi:hypothetical protein
MSRSYAVLAAALVGVLGLAGLLRLTQPDEADESAAAVEADPVVADPVADPVVVADPEGLLDDERSSGEFADEVRESMGLQPIAVIDPDCTLSLRLELGDSDPEVACLESQLIAAGALSEVGPDEVFDLATDTAVRAFQDANGLVVDGVVGPQTAKQLGVWVGPDVLPPDPASCPETGRSAVVDRFNQRAWLCEAGEITETMPMTSAISQPDPGTYEVYAKDRNASSNISGEYSEMEYFVAFTYGKYQGARIAFHSVPTYPNGEFVQSLDSVGTAELHGESAGCIRVLPEHAKLIWTWLDIGDTVKVVT